jgi:hypothetical protein
VLTGSDQSLLNSLSYWPQSASGGFVISREKDNKVALFLGLATRMSVRGFCIFVWIYTMIGTWEGQPETWASAQPATSNKPLPRYQQCPNLQLHCIWDVLYNKREKLSGPRGEESGGILDVLD